MLPVRKEARSFPDSIAIQRSRPWHAAEVRVSDLPPDAAGSDEGPGLVDSAVDAGSMQCARGSAEPAAQTGGARIPRGDRRAVHADERRGKEQRRTEYCIGGGNTAADRSHADASVCTLRTRRRIRIKRGCDEAANPSRRNLTAEIEATEGGLSPLVFAAERGHARLFAYLLSASLPASYFTPTESQVRTADEQRALDEWSFHRRRIIEEHATGLPLKGVDGEDASWIEYIAWYDFRRPLTPAEEPNAAFQSQLLRALQLAAPVESECSRACAAGRSGLRLCFSVAFERSQPRGRGGALIHGCIVHGLIDVASFLVQHGADLFAHTTTSPQCSWRFNTSSGAHMDTTEAAGDQTAAKGSQTAGAWSGPDECTRQCNKGEGRRDGSSGGCGVVRPSEQVWQAKDKRKQKQATEAKIEGGQATR